MPQLDTIHSFMVFLWSWFTLHLITQKMMTFKMMAPPKEQMKQTHPTMMTPPW